MAMNIDDCINTLINMDKASPVESESIDMAIKALEYRRPKSVEYDDVTGWYSCPNCVRFLMKTEVECMQDENTDGDLEYYEYKEEVPSFVEFCPECGQALNWKEVRNFFDWG